MEEKQTAAANCWNCGLSLERMSFCPHCLKVQPVLAGEDFFSVLGVPRRLNLDAELLQRNFHNLSRRLHPDFFSRAGHRERRFSLQRSAQLNDAYRALRDPDARLEYLIRLERPGRPLPRGAPPEVLEQSLEIQELVSQSRGQDIVRNNVLEARLRKARVQVDSVLAELDRKRQMLFDHWDQPDSDKPAALDLLGDLLSCIRFVRALRRQLDEIA